MTDLISRADAIEAVKETKPIVRSTERNWGKMIAEQHSKELVKALKALPSADAVDVAHDIPEYCSWSQTYTNMVQSAMSNASAEAVHKPDYSYEADMVRRLKESRSAYVPFIACTWGGSEFQRPGSTFGCRAVLDKSEQFLNYLQQNS